jgi:DMSO/TMAO reductase YedYZ molybdopterin-dependent catalytic subunit
VIGILLAGLVSLESADAMVGKLAPDIINEVWLNGAPIRLRFERQLGYKQAKYVMMIELVETLSGIAVGKGGYWEDDQGYEWYAGI